MSFDYNITSSLLLGDVIKIIREFTKFIVFYMDYLEKFEYKEVNYRWKCGKKRSQLNQLICSI